MEIEVLPNGYIEGVHWVDAKYYLFVIKDMQTEYLENIIKKFDEPNEYLEIFKRNVKYVEIEIRNRKLNDLLKYNN